VYYFIHCGTLRALRPYYRISMKERFYKLQKNCSKYMTTWPLVIKMLQTMVSKTSPEIFEESTKKHVLLKIHGSPMQWQLAFTCSKSTNIPSDVSLRIFPSLRSPIPFLSHLPTICTYHSKWIKCQCFFSMKRC